jgi:hypothetical protein
MPGCGLLVPTETNLLDAGLFPYEADTVSGSLWWGLALHCSTPQAKLVAGVKSRHPTHQAKACGGDEHCVIPHIGQKPVAGVSMS